MELPPIVNEQEWQEARDALLVKEKELTHARDAMAAERRRMPRMLVEKEYAFDGPRWAGEPARPVRGPPAADRLPLLLRARRERLAGEGLPRLLDDGRPERPSGAPERARHDVRARVPRAAGRHRAAARRGWAGTHPLVHDHRRLRQGLRRRRVARHQRRSCGSGIGSTAPTSSTGAATRHSAARSATSTSRRSGARRSWRTRPRATRRTGRRYSWWRRHDEYEPDPPGAAARRRDPDRR